MQTEMQSWKNTASPVEFQDKEHLVDNDPCVAIHTVPKLSAICNSNS